MNKKTRNIVLVAGFALVLLIAYQFAISDTLVLKDKYGKLKQQQELFKNAPQKYSLLRQKERYYDSILNANQLSGSSIQNDLLKTISKITEGTSLRIIDFSEPHLFKDSDYTIKTYSFSVNGNFNDIQQLLYHLEQKTSFGELVNVHYTRKRDFRRWKNFLEASVLIRSYDRD